MVRRCVRAAVQLLGTTLFVSLCNCSAYCVLIDCVFAQFILVLVVSLPVELALGFVFYFESPARRASLRIFGAPPVELAPGRGLYFS